MAAKLAPVQIVRRITLGIFLVGLTTLMVLHQKVQGIPSIDALDPFGGLETLLKWLAGGEFIKKIEPGTLVLFGGIVALGLVLSRFFCGWFCAFGALQGVFGWIGRKLFKRRFVVPAKLDRVLRWLKYPLLVGIIAWTWQVGDLVIRPYDPLAAFGHMSAGLAAVWAEFAVGLVIFVVVMIGSMFYERVFCKYVCPLGALNAILGRLPLFRLKRVESTCISCSKCDKACPMNIDVSKAGAINSPECISCMECVDSCPTKKKSLVATLGGKALKVSTIVILGFGIYFGAAAIGQATGALQLAAPSLKSLATEGKLKVEDIKGSSTYEMVAESFGVEKERLYRELGFTEKQVPSSTMLKDTGKLLGLEGFEADAVRVAVAKILGIPYAGEGGETKPAESSAAPEAAKPAEAKPVEVKAAAAFTVPADFVLEGTMSLAEVAKALGTTTAAVAAKLGLPADIATDKPLRDMKDQYGYTMPALKEKILK